MMTSLLEILNQNQGTQTKEEEALPPFLKQNSKPDEEESRQWGGLMMLACFTCQ
jgi:hypothetical protein